MSVGIDPTTIAQAGPWMAGALGLDWIADKCEVINFINRYRNLLYNTYPDLNLFDNVFHCLCVNTYPERCGDPCSSGSTYQGITLPSDVAGVVAAWQYGQPLVTRSRWREMHTGLGASRLPGIELVAMAEKFPTERHLTSISSLKMYAESEEDHCKVVAVDIVEPNNKKSRIQFTLSGDSWVRAGLNARQILSVTLPHDLQGSVTLAQSDGYVLSTYVPGETVPSYSRYKLTTSCFPGTVLVQGTKRFQRIYFDEDIVEVGDQLVIEAAGSFFKFRTNTTEKKELSRAEYDRGEMGVQLAGVVSRARGNSLRDGTPYRGRRVRPRNQLEGYDLRR